MLAVSLTSIDVPGLSREISLVTYLAIPEVFLDESSVTYPIPV